MPNMPPPPSSPWTWSAADYQGNEIGITVTFDNLTRLLTGVTVRRDPDCVYRRIFIGVGADGTPDTTDYNLPVPSGTTLITAVQLIAVGLLTITDITSLQITAGV